MKLSEYLSEAVARKSAAGKYDLYTIESIAKYLDGFGAKFIDEGDTWNYGMGLVYSHNMHKQNPDDLWMTVVDTDKHKELVLYFDKETTELSWAQFYSDTRKSARKHLNTISVEEAKNMIVGMTM